MKMSKEMDEFINKLDSLCWEYQMEIKPTHPVPDDEYPTISIINGDEVEKQGRSAFPGGQLYIDPNTCIDCGACITEYPPEAIYEDEDTAIAAGDEESVHKNYKFFKQEYQ